MALLSDHNWKTSYDSDDLSLVGDLYVPAMDCAVRYHRATGYFNARALALAARGIEGLLRNDGHMKLLVGCTLAQAEVEAIEKGQSLLGTVEARMLRLPLSAGTLAEEEALELLAWMVAQGHLEVKVAVPCDAARRPCPGEGIFHVKYGIIEDKTGDRLAFSGSINETGAGWGREGGANWEWLNVFTDPGDGSAYVRDIEENFATLWADRAKRALVVDVPSALQAELLRFLPPDGHSPRRLQPEEPEAPVEGGPEDMPEDAPEEVPAAPVLSEGEAQRLVWGIIRHGAHLYGGERLGEATSGIEPWPHQLRTYQRLWQGWPPRLLIADEVGLGKTITAGMMLRQAVLSGRARRVLVLAPKAVLRQWQVELREKFNLSWPIYDGHKLSWYRGPANREEGDRAVARDRWHREPFVIASSQLMRRRERTPELLEQGEPWDLVVLDEAHHARRRGVGGAKERGPNQLLRLMQGLRERTNAMLLLTATPMQVHPVEVWDLLNLLGLPSSWDAASFVTFFDRAGAGNPSPDDFEWLAARFREVEAHFGQTSLEEAVRCVPGGSKLATRKVLAALRDEARTMRRKLSSERRRAALRLMLTQTPVARLIARHTRELLRRYFKAGKISTPIATREVEDVFVEMSPAERDIYEMVEDYISSTYQRAAGAERNAVGFIMTVYRKRVASSFAALARTLGTRLAGLEDTEEAHQRHEDDAPDDVGTEEALDADEAEALAREALKLEERTEIDHLLGEVERLPTDTKAEKLVEKLAELRGGGFGQAMVFTQFTDTMDFLRAELLRRGGLRVLCYSGRGGERPSQDGTWSRISREEAKRVFSEGQADVLVCTDAAAEGLNFQFCGALVNYDMPWNPMRVEQRIGRIDRLGQRYEQIRIVNLHYDDTVETDVYRALRQRIGLFTKFVGRLQPILSRLPRDIAGAALAARSEQQERRATLVSDIDAEVRQAEEGGFDLDEVAAADLGVPPRTPAPFTLADLDHLVQTSDLLPPGVEVKPLIPGKEYQLSLPGMKTPIRVTTDPAYFDAHPESTELWSPGSPLFPEPEGVASFEEVAGGPGLAEVIERWRTSEASHRGQ